MDNKFDELRFELKRTDFGHLGLFPEQVENWEWIIESPISRKGRWAAGRLRKNPSPPAPV